STKYFLHHNFLFPFCKEGDWALWLLLADLGLYSCNFTPYSCNFAPYSCNFTPHSCNFTPYSSNFTPYSCNFTPFSCNFHPDSCNFTPHSCNFHPDSCHFIRIEDILNITLKAIWPPAETRVFTCISKAMSTSFDEHRKKAYFIRYIFLLQ